MVGCQMMLGGLGDMGLKKKVEDFFSLIKDSNFFHSVWINNKSLEK